MNRWVLAVTSAVCVSGVLAGCAVEKSSNPLSPTVAGPIPGVNITTPTLVSPIGNARVRADQQPVQLALTNAQTSGVRPLSYMFQIATDVAFGTVVFTQSGIAPGEGGKTNFRLPDNLGADITYYWRARAEDGANTGDFSSPASFQLFTPAVFGQPVPLSPIDNAVVNSLRPNVRWANAPRTGSPDRVQYRVEASDSPAFIEIITANIDEQDGGATTLPSPVDAPADRQIYWRVRAFDSISTGPWSATAIFRTPAPPPSTTPPPPTGPPGNVPGCFGGRLVDAKAYFFHVIGRKEGDRADDFVSVLAGKFPGGPPPGVHANPGHHYGITQQVGGAGRIAGRLFLPTDQPDDLGYYTLPVDILGDVGRSGGLDGLKWIWRQWSEPPYAPRPCN
jgi:hypothetical protein